MLAGSAACSQALWYNGELVKVASHGDLLEASSHSSRSWGRNARRSPENVCVRGYCEGNLFSKLQNVTFPKHSVQPHSKRQSHQLFMVLIHSRPQSPRFFWSAPRIDPWRKPKGSWALGTRMVLIYVTAVT